MDTTHASHGDMPAPLFGYCRQCSSREPRTEAAPKRREAQQTASPALKLRPFRLRLQEKC